MFRAIALHRAIVIRFAACYDLHTDGGLTLLRSYSVANTMDVGLVQTAVTGPCPKALEAGYRQVMAADSTQIAALMAQARALRAASDHAAALPILRAVAIYWPERAAVLVDLGMSLWILRQAEEAETILTRALEMEPDNWLALGTLGRIARQNKKYDAALALLNRALAQRPGDAGLREETARTLMHLNRLEEAAPLWQGLLEEAPDNRRILVAVGQLRNARGEFEAALALFQRAMQQNSKDPGLREDIARILIRLNRLDEAAALLHGLLQDAPANARLLLAFSQVRRGQRDYDAAAALARAAAEAAPSAPAYAALGDALVLGLDQPNDTLPARPYRQHEAEAEAAFLAAVKLAPNHAHSLMRLGKIARGRAEDAAALEWFRRAAHASPQDPVALFEVGVSLSDLRRHEEADAIFATIEAMPASLAHEQLRMRRLHQNCTALRLDAALACLREFGAVTELPSQAVSMAAGLLASLGHWDELLTLFAARVVPGTGVRHVSASDTLTESVARAARARRRQADVLSQLDRWSAAAEPAALRLRDQMADELILMHRVWPNRPDPKVLPAAPLRVARGVKIDAALAGAGQAVSGTVFMCTDLAYLPGTAVALASVLRHNRAALRACRFCVVLAPEAMALGQPILDELSAAYGLPIDVVCADTLGRSCSGLRRDWGTFTPGHRLSDAAYYRILAAIWLAAQPGAGRAIYIDSDTCIGPGLADMLRFDLAGRPLGARLEESASGAIRRAANKLGMAPEEYFNSGVLILDLAHPDCVPALHQAFDLAVSNPERLSFLDQCALNAAFLGKTMPVPDRFNTFVRHQDDVSKLPGDILVTHYLSRPKPWDPAYCTPPGARWLDEFVALADVLDVAQLRQLMAIPIRVAEELSEDISADQMADCRMSA